MTDLGAVLFLVLATAVLGLLFMLSQGRGRDDAKPTSGTPFDPPPPPR